MGANTPKSGPEIPTVTQVTSQSETKPEAPQTVDTTKEKKENKQMKARFMEGLTGQLITTLQAYGTFMEALEKLGAMDIMKELSKYIDKDGKLRLDNIAIMRIETELKKHLEGKLISPSDVQALKTNESAIKEGVAGEKPGDYIIRCLGLQTAFSKIPKRTDGKEYDPTMLSMIWLKLSGVVNLQGHDSIKDGFKAKTDTKKPILYENDIVYIKTGEKAYTAGFIKDFDLTNDKVILSTVENGTVVIKQFKMDQVVWAFHLKGNINIMTKSLDSLKPAQPDTTPPPPATTPTGPAAVTT